MPVLARKEKNMLDALKDYLKMRKELGGFYVKVGDSYIKKKLIGNTQRSSMTGGNLNPIRNNNETSENFIEFFQDNLLEEYGLRLVRKIGLGEIINDIKVAWSDDNEWIRKIGLIDTSEKRVIHPFTYCVIRLQYWSGNFPHLYTTRYRSKLEYYESFNSILIIRIGDHYYEKKKGQEIKEIEQLYEAHIQNIYQKDGKVKAIAFRNKYLDLSNMKFIKGEYRSEIGLFQYVENGKYFYIGNHDLYGPFTEKFANGTDRPFLLGHDIDIESVKEVNNFYGNTIEGQKFTIYYVGYGFIRKEISTGYDYGVYWRRESTDTHLYICRSKTQYFLVRVKASFSVKYETLGEMPGKKVHQVLRSARIDGKCFYQVDGDNKKEIYLVSFDEKYIPTIHGKYIGEYIHQKKDFREILDDGGDISKCFYGREITEYKNEVDSKYYIEKYVDGKLIWKKGPYDEPSDDYRFLHTINAKYTATFLGHITYYDEFGSKKCSDEVVELSERKSIIDSKYYYEWSVNEKYKGMIGPFDRSILPKK